MKSLYCQHKQRGFLYTRGVLINHEYLFINPSSFSVSEKMRISELAKATGVDLETIRYYEKQGLLPAPEREENGYRSYTGEHLERCRLSVIAGRWIFRWPMCAGWSPSSPVRRKIVAILICSSISRLHASKPG
jgi:hypothetical protein